MADREQLRAAITARLERATPENDFAPVTEPTALAEGRLLSGLLRKGDGNFEARYVLGWFHLYRSYARPAGQDQQDHDAAIELFTECFVAGTGGLPESLLPTLATRAVPAADSLLEQAVDSPDPETATAAVSLWRRIVAATADDDPDWAGRVSWLGVALLVRYGRTGGPADLDAAVLEQRKAVAATPEGDPSRVTRLSNLAVALLTRFDRTEAPEDLEAGIEAARSVVAATPADHRNLGMYQSNLAAALKTRFDWTGHLADLDDVVSMQQAAVQATPAGHPGLPRHLTNLAVAHQTRFLHAGDLADSDAAIAAQRAAIATAPPSHPDLPAMLSNLCGLQDKRFARTGEITDLDAAIEAGLDAVKAARDGAPGRARHLSNLGNALQTRFERTGRVADLDTAIQYHRDAVDACPDGNRDRAGCLANLGNALDERFRLTGALTDLDAAIIAAEGAVGAVPPGHPDRGRYLSNLGVKRFFRFDRCGERGDLGASIRELTAALDLVPEGHPERALYMSNLAIAIWERFGQDDAQADLEATIELERAAVDATPAGHSSRPSYQTVLGIALMATGTSAGISEAVTALQAAVDATPEDDPDRARRQYVLGEALWAQSADTNDESQRAAAIAACAEAAGQELARPSVRIRAARAAADYVGEADPGRAADLLETAVRLLGEVVPRELAGGDQQHQIRKFAGLASEAAEFALSDDRHPAPDRAARALRLLETGRAVLLTQLLDTRDDLTDLRRRRPELATRLRELRERLDTPATVVGTPGQEATLAPGQAAEDRRRLADQLAEALREIRATEGFADFGMPPAIEELTAQAAAGPVVIVNVGVHRSDALLLTTAGVTAVGLPELTRDALGRRIRAFHRAIGTPAAGSGYQNPISAQRAMTEVLGWLWDAAAEPILDVLGFREPPAGETSWPRLWWAPGGLLGLLPIHAAGHHADICSGTDSPRTVLDRVISSYTPTIRALRYARQRARRPARRRRALVVAMPVTPGLPGGSPLPEVMAEVGALKKLLPDPVILTVPEGSARVRAGALPTRANVLRYLPQCAIGHFACHGASHPSDPSQSLLLLHDHDSAPLTVSSLAPVQLDHLQLVYLSACRTAYVADMELLDEAIHLTSAFELAGARHVIGTLWEIHDATAATVAAGFYNGLRTAAGGLDPDRAARALHHTVRAVRDNTPRHPFLWAAYVHVGA